MKKIRLIAATLTLVMLIASLPLGASANEVLPVSLVSSVQEGDSAGLGETITVTAKIGKTNSGVVAGTFIFTPSENLMPISATVLSENVEMRQIIVGEFAGAYGVELLSETDITDTESELCSMTFSVTGAGEYSVSFDSYQVINSSMSEVSVLAEPKSISGIVALPDKPAVITDTLPRGLIGKGYSAKLETDSKIEEYVSFEIDEGELPQGLILRDDGSIEGIPTEHGDFNFSVIAIVADSVVSEPKHLTLTVLEKPEMLELKTESSYTVDESDYLRNVPEKIIVSELLENFVSKANVRVINHKGAELTQDSIVGTGSKICLAEGDNILHSLTVVIRGDIDGNGVIGPLDYQRTRAYYLGTFVLDSAAYEAAISVTSSDKIGPLNYQRVRAHYLGNYDLYE